MDANHSVTKPLTMYEKIWRNHLVSPESPEKPAVLYIDLHLLHEVTSPQAFDLLRQRGLPVRRPDRCMATVDHSVPTLPMDSEGRRPFVDAQALAQVERLRTNCRDFGIELLDLGDERQGIVHVIGPELGLTRPGMTIVCGDSHTSTHGAFGALAFGIGTSEVGHVLATQCLLQRKSKTMAVEVSGRLPSGVSAKDLILKVISEIGVGGASGFVIEYRGEAIRALDMEARMTICNMSIEAGARAGMIAPDERTLAYLSERPGMPTGKAWERQAEAWLALASDEGARFDRVVSFQGESTVPMVTYGTHPGHAVAVNAAIPAVVDETDAKALQYMGFSAGQAMLDCPVDVVFIGSCTNSRLSDLREAAAIFDGRKVAPGLRVLVVPGSQLVKRQAESEGLDRIFRAAGAEWREPGCSMCIAMNGDFLEPGRLAVSTSNRNFEGRQGRAAKTVLASPATAAAAAVCGRLVDPRSFALEVAHGAG